MLGSKKVIIIIPTYNESETIAATLDQLQNVFSKISQFDMGILVYDSNSPDGTRHIVREKQNHYPNLHLASEEKKSGLGSAYSKAMRYAMHKLNADIVFEFDADGSHAPEYIPHMLEYFNAGYDVIIGSRFVKGGSIPRDWSFHRKFLSIMGNCLAQLILSSKIKDYTAGFRATRTKYLEKIDLDNLLSKNYAYKIHLVWELLLNKANIFEYPIKFIDRQKGYSKFPKHNALESLILIFRLRLQTIKRYIKVCSVGTIGMLIQLALFNILRLHMTPVFANMLSIEAAIISNFILNNHFSYSDRKLSKKHTFKYWLKKSSLFNLFSIGSLLLQTLIMLFGVGLFGDGVLKENSYLLVGVGIASIYNYKMFTRFVWSKK